MFCKQVYEDPVQGILCYTDDNGEVICEGYDEGPRCPPESPVVTSYSRYDNFINHDHQIDPVYRDWFIKNREVEILDLLQRSYQELRVAEKGDGQRQEAASQQELKMIKWSSFDFL